MTELTEELIQKMMPRIKQVMEEFKLDSEEELIELLRENWKDISERPSSTRLRESILFNKALGKSCSELAQRVGGERFNVFVLGYEIPRDWNADERQSILDSWAKGPKNQLLLTQNGQVMTMKKAGKDVVVSRIDKWAITPQGEYVILSGKEIEPGEKPVPRDNRQFLSDGKTKNNKHTYPLEPRWVITQHGAAMVDKGFKLYEARIYGNLADPTHKEFLPFKAPAFGTYKAVFGIDEKNTTEELMRFNFMKAITPLEEESTVEEIIYNLIDNGVIIDYAATKEEMEGAGNEYPDHSIFLVNLGEVTDFHNNEIRLFDENHQPIKTKGGYDKVNWGRFAIGIYYITSKTDIEGGNTNIRFRDWTGKSNGIFTNETIQFDEENFPIECVISFRTSKSNKRWDAENKVQVLDPLNGDVTLGRLLGIRKTTDILDVSV